MSAFGYYHVPTLADSILETTNARPIFWIVLFLFAGFIELMAGTAAPAVIALAVLCFSLLAGRLS